MISALISNKFLRNRCFFSSTSQVVFDRPLKCRQRDSSIKLVDSNDYDYLRKEIAERIVDRLDDITKTFPIGLDVSCHKGHIFKSLLQRESLISPGLCVGGLTTLVQCDMSVEAIKAIPISEAESGPLKLKTHVLVADEESLPFEPNSYDIVFSSLGLHWVNDLPSTLKQIKLMLKPDGVFIGCLLGGSTLHELKRSFYLAELERKGGLSYHISPMVRPSDVAGLLQGAGFSLPTIDVDTIQVGYPNAFVLMEHLQRMGENTAFLQRQYSVGREAMLAMASIYQQEHAVEGVIPATFQVIYMIGWSPHSSQPQPLARGCAEKSLKEALQK